MQMMKRLAREGRAAIGGGFLARSGRDVFNTFALVLPSGEVFTHDKDFPPPAWKARFTQAGKTTSS